MTWIKVPPLELFQGLLGEGIWAQLEFTDTVIVQYITAWHKPFGYNWHIVKLSMKWIYVLMRTYSL